MSRPITSDTGKELTSYLVDNPIPEAQRLPVALVFAEGMVRYLRSALAQWERTLILLRRVDDERRFDAAERN